MYSRNSKHQLLRKSELGIRPQCAVYHITLLTSHCDRAALLRVVVGPLRVEQDIRVEKEQSTEWTFAHLVCDLFPGHPRDGSEDRIASPSLTPMRRGRSGRSRYSGWTRSRSTAQQGRWSSRESVSTRIRRFLCGWRRRPATPAVRNNDAKNATQYMATLTGVVASPATVTVADSSGLSVVKTVIAT
jgi:hypothetical protein